jgi:hypothetical protein
MEAAHRFVHSAVDMSLNPLVSHTFHEKEALPESICPVVQVFWKKLTGQEGARPQFTFKENQFPEQV